MRQIETTKEAGVGKVGREVGEIIYLAFKSMKWWCRDALLLWLVVCSLLRCEVVAGEKIERKQTKSSSVRPGKAHWTPKCRCNYVIGDSEGRREHRGYVGDI